MKYAIQWYDCYDLTPSGRARKDGPPRGSYDTEQQAADTAEAAIEKYGAFEITYKVVKLPTQGTK